MAKPDYGRATWYGAHENNFTNTSRESSDPINKVIIHVVQGSWSSALNWFKDGRAQVSAHYTVRSSDGKIGQSVQEQDIAWHAGYWDYNRTSIGIEHEGYVSEPKKWFTDAMYNSSAKLTAYLCKKYKIPIDRKHILGHYEVPGCSGPGGGSGCHTDPGSGWNWTRYMRLVRKYADVKQPYTMVVDNSSSRFSASKNWDVNSWNKQRYGKNYRAVTPKNINDPARFKLKVPKKGIYGVSAWWPANEKYNPRVRFWIRTANNGWVKKIRSQRKNGGKWVWLGNFTLEAGDRVYVQVSRQSGKPGHIIADAVRIRKKS
jgi:N-acetyl-anhydromuramyl-L-alanine amidase AmpD